MKRFTILALLLAGCPGPSPDTITLPTSDCILEYSIEMTALADEERLCELSLEVLKQNESEEWDELNADTWSEASSELLIACENQRDDRRGLSTAKAIRAMRCAWLCEDPTGDSIDCEYQQ